MFKWRAILVNCRGVFLKSCCNLSTFYSVPRKSHFRDLFNVKYLTENAIIKLSL